MPETRNSAAGRRVLLIADNRSDMTLFADIIAAQGHRVLEAASGLRGVDLARQRQPDLIVMKIETPGMSAVEVIEALKSDDDTRRIPVIVITAGAHQGGDEIQIDGYEFQTIEMDVAAAFGELINLLATPHKA